MFDFAKSKREDLNVKNKTLRPAFIRFRSGKLTDSRGTQYIQDQDGVLRRANPKPYKGKSGRRQMIKARREDRALAAENLKAA